jgi:hypothetical protein
MVDFFSLYISHFLIFLPSHLPLLSLPAFGQPLYGLLLTGSVTRREPRMKIARLRKPLFWICLKRV